MRLIEEAPEREERDREENEKGNNEQNTTKPSKNMNCQITSLVHLRRLNKKVCLDVPFELVCLNFL